MRLLASACLLKRRNTACSYMSLNPEILPLIEDVAEDDDRDAHLVAGEGPGGPGKGGDAGHFSVTGGFSSAGHS